MISIVTAYYNRLDLFMNTLKTIEKSEIKDIEVIAVDDGSSEEHRLEGIVDRFPFLKVIRIEPSDKWWVNPCVPFNMGFKEAKGDIIILQNPECKHMGDVLKRASQINKDEYISFACYSIDEETTYGSMKKLQIIDRSVTHDGELGWYNHSRLRPVGYHFCSVIHKSNLDELGGFDERYADGIAYDDNEILHRIAKMGLKIGIVDEPFVIHQWHYSGNNPRPNSTELLNKNKNLLYNVTMKESSWKANQKTNNTMKLSILIPSVPSRRKFFLDRLLDDLEKQIGTREDIEILVLYDNKKRSLGQKRSDLLNLARGEFTVFIDDDDRISEDYISSIMEAIEKDPSVDCIVYDCICTIDGGIPVHCKYGIELDYNHNNSGEGYWTGKPAHTMVYASRISKKHAFIDASYGEDIQWVRRAVNDLKTQTRVDKVLYYYDFNSDVTETRGLR